MFRIPKTIILTLVIMNFSTGCATKKFSDANQSNTKSIRDEDYIFGLVNSGKTVTLEDTKMPLLEFRVCFLLEHYKDHCKVNKINPFFTKEADTKQDATFVSIKMDTETQKRLKNEILKGQLKLGALFATIIGIGAIGVFSSLRFHEVIQKNIQFSKSFLYGLTPFAGFAAVGQMKIMDDAINILDPWGKEQRELANAMKDILDQDNLSYIFSKRVHSIPNILPLLAKIFDFNLKEDWKKQLMNLGDDKEVL